MVIVNYTHRHTHIHTHTQTQIINQMDGGMHGCIESMLSSEVKTHLQDVSHLDLSWVVHNELVVVERVTSRVRYSGVLRLPQRHNCAIGPQPQHSTTWIMQSQQQP